MIHQLHSRYYDPIRTQINNNIKLRSQRIANVYTPDVSRHDVSTLQQLSTGFVTAEDYYQLNIDKNKPT